MALHATAGRLSKFILSGSSLRPLVFRGMATAADVEKALKERLKASNVVRSHGFVPRLFVWESIRT